LATPPVPRLRLLLPGEQLARLLLEVLHARLEVLLVEIEVGLGAADLELLVEDGLLLPLALEAERRRLEPHAVHRRLTHIAALLELELLPPRGAGDEAGSERAESCVRPWHSALPFARPSGRPC
jgi:hypothetical protein